MAAEYGRNTCWVPIGLHLVLLYLIDVVSTK
jgi:hypothetical protein